MNHQNAVKRSSLRGQLGASATEAIIFLVIASIVLIGAIAFLRRGYSDVNTNKIGQEMVQITTGVKRLYTNSLNYGTVGLNTQLVNAVVFPDYLKVDTTTTPYTVFNTWNGTITVTGATANFTVSYTLVPQDVCLKHLASQGSGGLISVTVNGGSSLTVPVSPTAANTACSAATNTIVWTAA